MSECIIEVTRTLQAWHFVGALTIGDEVLRTGEHGIEHELVIHTLPGVTIASTDLASRAPSINAL